MGEDGQVVTRKQAILRGLPSYFTGNPCKYGHIDRRGTRSRQCLECTRITQRKLYEIKPKVKRDRNSQKAKSPFVMVVNHHHRVLLAIAGLGKISSTLQRLGCDRVELRSHIESHFEPDMSWDNQGEWDIELHIPASQFDLLCHEQRQICFHYQNLRPIWTHDRTGIRAATGEHPRQVAYPHPDQGVGVRRQR